ncbi:MAG: signal peptidase II [SAR202 cluster bacterium Io17-Chloro-G2]|nr:MAG: signal peptidase II [SAR202 cluster bacterium Io17-Chloro-G2]
MYRDLVLLQLAALVFLCDQFTKFVVRVFLPYRFSFPEEGFFRITHTHNTGSAFGLFQDQNLPLIVASMVGITVLALIFQSQPRQGHLLRLSIGMQLGGAIGNLLDRFRLGHVTDFLDVGAWPVFNVADASIVTGLIMLGWLFLVQDRTGRSGRQDDSASATVTGAGGQGFWCPVCGGEMVALYGGWKCSSCGFKEKFDEKPAAVDP